MSFLAKLLIFFGWMLIFSMKQSDEQIYPYPYNQVIYTHDGKLMNMPNLDPGEQPSNSNDDISTGQRLIKQWLASFNNPEVGIFPPGLDITVLDAVLNLTLTKVGNSEQDKKIISRLIAFSRDLEQLTSGGPAAANPPKGKFGGSIGTVIAAVALHLVLLRVQVSIYKPHGFKSMKKNTEADDKAAEE